MNDGLDVTDVELIVADQVPAVRGDTLPRVIGVMPAAAEFLAQGSGLAPIQLPQFRGGRFAHAGHAAQELPELIRERFNAPLVGVGVLALHATGTM